MRSELCETVTPCWNEPEFAVKESAFPHSRAFDLPDAVGPDGKVELET
jgi:hypothetical protein